MKRKGLIVVAFVLAIAAAYVAVAYVTVKSGKQYDLSPVDIYKGEQMKLRIIIN